MFDLHSEETIRTTRDLHGTFLTIKDDRILLTIAHTPRTTGVSRGSGIAMPIRGREMEHGRDTDAAVREEIKLKAKQGGDGFTELGGLGGPDLLEATHAFLLVSHGAFHVLDVEFHALEGAGGDDLDIGRAIVELRQEVAVFCLEGGESGHFDGLDLGGRVVAELEDACT